jgi:hypothetical protein
LPQQQTWAAVAREVSTVSRQGILTDQPRRAAFQAVWRERQLGSDADAALAEKRFRMQRSTYRAGRTAPPVEWQQPGSRLAEALGL